MSEVTLELAKQHLKIDDSAEDALISLYIEAAEAWCGNYLGKTVGDLQPVPADIKLAILRLVAFYFECRNIASFGLSVELAPHGVTSILDSYRERWFTDAA